LAPVIANPRFDVTDYVYAESATSSPGELTECLSYLTATATELHSKRSDGFHSQSTIDSLQSIVVPLKIKAIHIVDYKDTAKEKRGKGEPERYKDKNIKDETIMSSTGKISAVLRRHT
jgi:hypothetical protein